jgi:hypothetical protein
MGKPRIKDPKGRELVRDVLNLAQGYGYSEKSLLDNLNELAEPAEANLSQLREWIEWNHGRQYVRTEFNEDQEMDLWFITSEGIAKESIK